MQRMVDYTLHIENNALIRVEPIFEWDFEDFCNFDDDSDWYDFDDEFILDDEYEDAEETNVLNLVKQEVQSEVPLKKACERKNSSEINTITIPDGVTKIEKFAFIDCKEIEKIMLPDSLEVIEHHAFYGCSCLENLKIPENVVYIGEEAFCMCSSLREVKLPNRLKKIENHLFSECRNLEKIIIPEGVEEIGDAAFLRCRKLHDLELPKSLKKIGARFFESEAGIEGVTLPASVTTIHYSNFESRTGTFLMKSEEETTIYRLGIDWIKVDPENTAYCIVDDMLLTADKKTVLFCFRTTKGKITIPEGVECIGRYAFSNCNGITEIYIPDSVAEMGEGAFYKCQNLKKIILPSKLNTLSERIFQHCSKLEKVVLHESISYIAPWAFGGCDSLEYIEIPSSVQCIGNYAFSGCDKLKQVDIAEGMKKIGKGAFDNCRRLYEIRIPDSVECMEEDIFCGCKYVTITCYHDSEAEYYAVLNDIKRNYYWLDISEEEYKERKRDWEEYKISCEIKQENPFYRVENEIVYSKDGTQLIRCPQDYKGTVVVADGVTAIRKEAFYQCEQIEKVKLPEGLLYIGDYAFYECMSLKEVSFPESLIAIGKGAFEYCEKLDSALLGNQLRSLGEEAFYETNIKEVVLPKTLTSDCGENVFGQCGNLYIVRLPQFFNGLEMEKCLQFFDDCENLEHIIIEENGRECVWEDEGEYYSTNGLVLYKRRNSLAYCPPGRKGVLYIPEGIAYSERDAFSRKCKITGVVFPESWKQKLVFENSYSDKESSRILYACGELEFVEVSSKNDLYISENGMLFTKDRKQLLYCPRKKKGVVEVPEGVEFTMSGAFSDCCFITEIHYPKTYKSLDQYSGCDSLMEIYLYDSWELFGRSIKECGNLEKFFGRKIKVVIKEEGTK